MRRAEVRWLVSLCRQGVLGVLLLIGSACGASPSAPSPPTVHAVVLGEAKPVSPLHGTGLPAGTTSTILTARNAAAPAGALVFIVFEVAGDAAFSNVLQALTVSQSAGETTAATIDDLDDGRSYFWRVRAVASESAGSRSEIFSFSIARPVGVAQPELAQPLDGATMDNTLRFVVTRVLADPALGPVTQRLELARDPEFTSTVLTRDQVQSSGPSTIFNVTDSLVPGAYYWRARGSAASTIGPWSNTRRIVVGPAFAEMPRHVAPPNGSTIPTQRVTMIVANAAHSGFAAWASYRFQISRTPDFAAPFYNGRVSEFNPETTSDQSYDLDPGMYYWRTQTVGDSVSSAWTDPWTFTVAPEIIQLPAAVSPGMNAIVHPQPELVVTNARRVGGGGALVYRFELAVELPGVFYGPGGLIAAADVPEHQSGRTSWRAPADLVPGQRYRWRVLVVDPSTGIQAPSWVESRFETVPAASRLWFLDIDLPGSCETRANLSSYYAATNGPVDAATMHVTTDGKLELRLDRGVGTFGGRANPIRQQFTAQVTADGNSSSPARARGGTGLFGEISGTFDGRIGFGNAFENFGQCTAAGIRWTLRPR